MSIDSNAARLEMNAPQLPIRPRPRPGRRPARATAGRVADMNPTLLGQAVDQRDFRASYRAAVAAVVPDDRGEASYQPSI